MAVTLSPRSNLAWYVCKNSKLPHWTLKGVVDNILMSASQTVSYKVWQRERNSDDTHPHTMVVVVTEISEASRLQGKSHSKLYQSPKRHSGPLFLKTKV